MRFLIERTSHGWKSEIPPCPQAVKEVITRTLIATGDEPLPMEDNDWWYKDGRNHRVEDGFNKKDIDEEVWVIYIKDLEELVAFLKEQGGDSLVLSTLAAPTEVVLEIYDDYRE